VLVGGADSGFAEQSVLFGPASGFAGKLWGYENYGVEPDLMSLAKPLAGGLPIGAVLLKQKVADAMKPGGLHPGKSLPVRGFGC
jgi:hypothetical protein